MKHKPRASWTQRLWQGWVKPFLVVVIVVSTFRSAVADWNDVPTGSMKPSIVEGDRIFVNKCAYALKVPFTSWRIAEWSQPRRGDVVVCFSPEDGKRLVKRIVALPGQTVELRDNVLIIDGKAAAYAPPGAAAANRLGPVADGRVLMLEKIDGRSHPVLFTPGIRAMRCFGPVRVPAGQYFLLGDNRDSSRDSRFFGPVARRQIVGRAPAVVFSLNRDRYYRPRGDRFFRSIP